MNMLYALVLAAALATVRLASGSENECRLLQVVTKMGVGLYAGKDYGKDEEVEAVLGIPVHISTHRDNILDNYVEGYWEPNMSMVTLGYAMVYNHAPDKFYTLKKHTAPQPVVEALSHLDINEPDSSTVVVYSTNSKISRGDQILNYYGETWFRGPKRPTEEINPCSNPSVDGLCRVDLASATVLPGCPMQFASLARGKLFASVNIKAGTVIEVSRALVLPVSQMHGSRGLQSLLWYFHTSPKSSDEMLAYELFQRSGVALVLNDFGAMVMSQSTTVVNNDGEQITTEVPLIDENALLLLGYGSFYSPAEIYDANVAFSRFLLDNEDPLACQHEDTMFVQFRAVRDILAGELLTVDLERVAVRHQLNEISPEANWRRVVRDNSFAQDCLRHAL